MFAEEYKDCLNYIDSYWDNLIRLPDNKNVRNGFLPLPYLYIIPNDKKFSNLFYWDSYFMFRGLMGTNRSHVMRFVVDDFIHLYKKYGIIPNFNSHASADRSQPPFLSSMVRDVFRQERRKKWFENRMDYARHEYNHVWNDTDGSYNHRVEGYELNKYGDRDIGYSHTAELESGWDFTSRFYNRCAEFLPVDLNSFLYKYETDFIYEENLFQRAHEMHFWHKKADIRREHMYEHLWNEEKGFFFDYDYINKSQSSFFSLAGFTPLWAGIAYEHQAAKMVLNLPLFETRYGLLITAEQSMPKDVLRDSPIPEEYKRFFESMLKPKQWDYPHIWPPLEYLTVIGLLKYGYIDDAKRIMKKSLKAQAKIFRKYNTFFEKINGVKGDAAISFHYPNQSGFGWTNAEFFRYVIILDYMQMHGDDSIYQFPMEQKPPYELNILH